MPTTAISSSASIGKHTTLGHYCVIEDHVTIGTSCQIGHHVILHKGTTIGNHVRIDNHTIVGKQPVRASNSTRIRQEQLPPAHVGAQCLIGASVILYADCTLEENVFVADMATIRENVHVGAHTIVGRGVAIENACTIGRYCKLETNAYITAYSRLENRVFVAPGVLTSNDNFAGRTPDRHKYYKGVHVHQGGRLGVGAIILPGREVGDDAFIAAGGVLTRDATPGEIWAGIPAQPFRQVPPAQLLKNQGWSDITSPDPDKA